jgi:nitroimidazol reductase NimA-like FMN-containing flavoprotein (pyridoxamine 5'-phosphate oxidase superfamily)
MEQKNLDIYGNDPIPWSRPLEQLKGFAAQPGQTTWLSTSRPDGRPHTAGVGALWLDDRFYFTSGPGTRKSRNLAENPNCVIAVTLQDIDLVVEGRAARVTDEATLERVTKHYVDSGWPASVDDGALTAAFSAPSAGPPPWYVYEMTPTVVFGVANAEPHGATRWRFT